MMIIGRVRKDPLQVKRLFYQLKTKVQRDWTSAEQLLPTSLHLSVTAFNGKIHLTDERQQYKRTIKEVLEPPFYSKAISMLSGF